MNREPAFDSDRFLQLRRARSLRLGEPLCYVASTTSTNDDALNRVSAGVPDGATFVADFQSAGRGRRGRRWLAEAGTSLLCSVVVRRDFPPEVVPTLSLAGGLAVRSVVDRALRAAGVNAQVLVKWPNDVWVDSRKIAGILTESQVQSGKLVAMVMGFGINDSSSTFPDELRTSSTSLASHSATAPREELLVELLDALDQRLTELESCGFSKLRAEFLRYDALVGRCVRIDGTSGVASGIDDEGRLLVKPPGSERIAVSAGTVELEPVSGGDTRGVTSL